MKYTERILYWSPGGVVVRALTSKVARHGLNPSQGGFLYNLGPPNPHQLGKLKAAST